MTFLEIVQRIRKHIPQVRVLAFDPGETTGMALFVNGEMSIYDQLNTKDLDKSVEVIQYTIATTNPDYIVMEDYKVYGWKSDSHAWSVLHTPQLLGIIRTLAVQNRIPLETRMAVDAKTFCTDKKLEDWGFYRTGVRHARDAIRHATYSYLFSKHELFTKPKP